MKRRIGSRLYYFTVEDEGLLAEAFPQIEDDVYAIAYKVRGTDDVFVTTAETKEAMDRNDVPYNALAEEDATRISLFHSPLSREELGDYEDALKALALAYRAIGLSCIGINGDTGLDFEGGGQNFSYFTAPAGHTFLWRLFFERDDAISFVNETCPEDPDALEWAHTLPLDSNSELAGYH